MPTDQYGNLWGTQLQAEFWNAGNRPDEAYTRSGENNHENWERAQILAERWAREHRPELLLLDPPPPDPVFFRVGRYTFTTSEAARMFDTMESTGHASARAFAGTSPESQLAYMQTNWRRIMGTEFQQAVHLPNSDPWVNHARGPHGADHRFDTEYPFKVHGWVFRTEAAANYFTTLLNSRPDDDAVIAGFPAWTLERQEQWMSDRPLEHLDTPTYFIPTMPTHRDSYGRFSSPPKKRRSVSLHTYLFKAIHLAVSNKKGDEAPKKATKPRSTPDKIMRHFAGREMRPPLEKCVPSGTWREEGEFTWVYTDPEDRERREAWEPSYLDGRAVRCLASRLWYAADMFQWVEIVEHRGAGVAEIENARNRGWCQWADGRWHDRRPPPTPEERMAAVRAQGANNIPQYHQIRPEWRDGRVLADEPLFGIELEIQSKKRREICTIAENLGFIGEQDGTLCRETGLEIVAPPFTFDQIRDQKGKWLTFLKSIQGQVRGWDAGTNYGMHVSISRETLKKDHQIRLMCFIHDSRSLCEVVAGREANEWCTFKKKPRDERALIQDILPRGHRYAGNPDKYEACCIRGEHRIEMRIFRSTVNAEGFMRNVEFTVASVDYTKDPKGEPSQERFLNWIREDKPSKDYPHLYRFLDAKGKEIKPAPPIEEQMVIPEPEPRPSRRARPSTFDRVFEEAARRLQLSPRRAVTSEEDTI